MMINRTALFLITLLLPTIKALSTDLRFSGNNMPVITERPDAITGLEAVYVINDITGVHATYTASSASSQIRWIKFGYLGAAYAEEIPLSELVRSGTESTLTQIEGDMGYGIEENGQTTYFWIVNHAAHPYSIEGIDIGMDQACDMTELTIQGSADRITYYSINARSYELDRGINVSYTTLSSENENGTFESVEYTQSFAYAGTTIRVPAPLCNTYFSINGDKYLREWGIGKEATSSLYSAIAVDAKTTAEQTKRNNDNEIKSETTIGGSAPVEVRFNATVSDAAIYTEWQFATDADFENITLRSNDTEFTHTFREMGTTYVRFTAANADASCDYYSETYTVYIGESSLLCPNAFSPGSSPGVNDEWKVSYKSIVSFECYIFNRWGIKMTEFHDPSQGWDGKYGGKLVPAGVYYYVIKAVGSDGKKYNLSGDINIIGYSN